MRSDLHKKLQQEAIYWLYKRGCEIYADEVGFRGEVLDTVGMMAGGDTFCIEVKATQADLDRARQETNPLVRVHFNYYYLLIPAGLQIKNEWVGWGILEFIETQSGIQIMSKRKAKRQEKTSQLWEWLELVFKTGGKLAREKYFNNFR